MLNFRLPIFITDTHPCSYLEGETARTAFVDPTIQITPQIASALNSKGFRRSGRYLYRTNCEQCNACMPLRVPVEAFSPNRSQRRNQRTNSDLSVRLLETFDAEIYYPIYERYINSRHRDGDMYPPDRAQFDSFIGQMHSFSRLAEFSLDGQAVMLALFDELTDGLSAIYTFFEPGLENRGLGVYSILWQLSLAKRLQLDFVYLGFWIQDCLKMNYKTQYRPCQLFVDDQWQDRP